MNESDNESFSRGNEKSSKRSKKSENVLPRREFNLSYLKENIMKLFFAHLIDHFYHGYLKILIISYKSRILK